MSMLVGVLIDEANEAFPCQRFDFIRARIGIAAVSTSNKRTRIRRQCESNQEPPQN